MLMRTHKSRHYSKSCPYNLSEDEDLSSYHDSKYRVFTGQKIQYGRERKYSVDGGYGPDFALIIRRDTIIIQTVVELI
jgi:hypothetical protein